jgi:hypothetical protein
MIESRSSVESAKTTLRIRGATLSEMHLVKVKQF